MLFKELENYWREKNNMLTLDFNTLREKLQNEELYYVEGLVKKVIGLTIEVEGIRAFVGEVCTIYNDKERPITCEAVGFKDDNVILMPLGELTGIAPGCRVVAEGIPLSVNCSEDLYGMVLDGLGKPLDGTELKVGVPYRLDNSPPDPLKRRRIKDVIPTGVKSIDGFLTCGEGQRVGIFAGSGVGKSTTLGMIAKYAQADVNVIALIGERGREVLDFI
jgi:flagellum-specific ATP synthase